MKTLLKLIDPEAVFVILAPHPDDEVLGCGVLIRRLRKAGHQVQIAFLTSGIAEHKSNSQELVRPYGNHLRYCSARLTEKGRVISRLSCGEYYSGDRPSRTLFRELNEVYRSLLSRLRQLDKIVLLCPAYEGGHPDHDAANCLGYQLSRELNVSCLEYALYHRWQGRTRYHKFLAADLPVWRIRPTAAERAAKTACLRLYHSQYLSILRDFPLQVECFRLMPRYDYRRPPTAEAAYYEIWNCGVNAVQVSQACRTFLRKQAITRH